MKECCRKCDAPLIYEFELDLDMCGECQDEAIAKHERMKDWQEFHGDYYDEFADE